MQHGLRHGGINADLPDLGKDILKKQQDQYINQPALFHVK